ncbi:pyridoxamine 5'-phosphate oxidase [Bdellovibrio sp. qaytius]|nr:pyridoxamine 5'-phosphate oxidase [Bdellovibrio sp. qaytius]
MSFDFKKDPFLNFQNSLKTAQLKGIPEHQAMSIATVNEKNEPSVRVVYFKGLIRGGFSFYTNYDGRKGHDLDTNPNICANFFWPHLDEQVRISGFTDKLTDSESDQYFATRARLSQLGAWASLQSSEMQNFDQFHQRMAEFTKKFEGQKVPRPPHWGGYRIIPREIEFWFGKNGRLHERYVYTATNSLDKITNATEYQWKTSLRFP